MCLNHWTERIATRRQPISDQNTVRRDHNRPAAAIVISEGQSTGQGPVTSSEESPSR